MSTKLTEREHVLGVMLELTQQLVSSLDFQDILYTMVSRVAEVIDVDRVSIVLVPHQQDGSKGGVGHVVAASDDAAVFNLRLDLDKYPEIRHVLATRQPLRIGDVLTHPLLDGVRSSVAGAGLTALSLVPLVWDEQVMGVLFIRAATGKGALDEEQLGFCQVLANATAIALRNARVLQSLRSEAQQVTHARMEAERRLQSLKSYADVFASSADGILVMDRDTRVLFANPQVFSLLGYEEQELLGRSSKQLVHPEDRGPIGDKLRVALRTGEYPECVDLRVKHKEDRYIVLNGSFSVLSDSEGAIVFSFRDVTEVRKTEAELVQTKNFLESLIDASVDAIVASDMHGRIILFNRGAERIYGRRADDVVRKLDVSELYPGDGAREVGRMLRSEQFGGVGRLEPVQIEAKDAQGNVFPISLSAATIYEDGKPTANFGIFTDLRDRLRVEEQLAQAQEKLAISEKQSLIAELAGATAHELNQPLTSVMGYTELLLRRMAAGDPNAEAIEVIHQEASRMAEIVRKIGRLTRYETKSYVGHQKILDFDRSVDEVDSNTGTDS